VLNTTILPSSQLTNTTLPLVAFSHTTTFQPRQQQQQQRLQSYNYHVFSPTFVHHYNNDNNKQQNLAKFHWSAQGNSNWCTFLNIIIIMMACLSTYLLKNKNKLCAGVAEATTTTASVLSGSSSKLIIIIYWLCCSACYCHH
jgi:hypothetical protein